MIINDANEVMKMRYPETAPLLFSGARKFVEEYGFDVWHELCETVTPEEFFNVTDTALKLDSLKRYRSPARYLRAVLKAALADYSDRPGEYNRPPVVLRGLRIDYASV